MANKQTKKKLAFDFIKLDKDGKDIAHKIRSGSLSLTKDEMSRLTGLDLADEVKLKAFIESVVDRLENGKTYNDGQAGKWSVRAHEQYHLDEIAGRIHPGPKDKCSRCRKSAAPKVDGKTTEEKDSGNKAEPKNDEPNSDVDKLGSKDPLADKGVVEDDKKGI